MICCCKFHESCLIKLLKDNRNMMMMITAIMAVILGYYGCEMQHISTPNSSHDRHRHCVWDYFLSVV